MGDAHRDVVRDHREVVDGGVVTSQDNEIVEVSSLEADPAVHRIVPRDLLVLQEEPDRRRSSGHYPRLDLRRAQPVTSAVVAEAGTRHLRRRALSIKLLSGAEAAIGLSLRQESLCVGLMTRRILTLEVGPFI